eukprot:6207283-Pleurochrysis_carterae.AAC.2
MSAVAARKRAAVFRRRSSSRSTGRFRFRRSRLIQGTKRPCCEWTRLARRQRHINDEGVQSRKGREHA